MKTYYYVHYKDSLGYAVYRMDEDGDSKFIVSYIKPEDAAHIAEALTNWAEYES